MKLTIKALFLAALALLVVAAESIRETTNVQLASELNVGFELLSSCAQQGSLNYEATELCQGRQTFQFYSTEGCISYFWCSPEHAACIKACPSGTVFNHACSCCQDNAAAFTAGFDDSTCSSTAQTVEYAPQPQQQQQQQQQAPPTLAGRHLLQAQPDTTHVAKQSSSSSNVGLHSQDQMRTRARARARIMRRRRRVAALRAAAAAAADSPASSSTSDSKQGAAGDAMTASESISSDMPSGQLFLSKRRMARRTSRGGDWNSYGKRYSSGGFAGKNIVKEPAVRMPSTTAPAAAAAVMVQPAAAQQPAAAAEAAVAAATSGDAQQQFKQAAAAAAAGSSTTSGSAELRQLLADTPQLPAAAAAAVPIPVAAQPGPNRHIPVAGRRDVQMKRVQRFAAQAAATVAAAGDPAEVAATGDALEHAVHGGQRHNFVLNPKLRPMDQKPAAKAIDPEDEQAAPFEAALAAKQQQHQQMKQQVKQHSRASGQQAARRVPL